MERYTHRIDSATNSGADTSRTGETKEVQSGASREFSTGDRSMNRLQRFGFHIARAAGYMNQELGAFTGKLFGLNRSQLHLEQQHDWLAAQRNHESADGAESEHKSRWRRFKKGFSRLFGTGLVADPRPSSQPSPEAPWLDSVLRQQRQAQTAEHESQSTAEATKPTAAEQGQVVPGSGVAAEQSQGATEGRSVIAAHAETIAPDQAAERATAERSGYTQPATRSHQDADRSNQEEQSATSLSDFIAPAPELLRTESSRALSAVEPAIAAILRPQTDATAASSSSMHPRESVSTPESNPASKTTERLEPVVPLTAPGDSGEPPRDVPDMPLAADAEPPRRTNSTPTPVNERISAFVTEVDFHPQYTNTVQSEQGRLTEPSYYDAMRVQSRERHLRQQRDSMTAVAVLAGAAFLYQRHKRKSETRDLRREVSQATRTTERQAQAIAALQAGRQRAVYEVGRSDTATRNNVVVEATNNSVPERPVAASQSESTRPAYTEITPDIQAENTVVPTVEIVNATTSNLIKTNNDAEERSRPIEVHKPLRPRAAQETTTAEYTLLPTTSNEQVTSTAQIETQIQPMQRQELDPYSVTAQATERPAASSEHLQRRTIRTNFGAEITVVVPSTSEAETTLKQVVRQLEAAQTSQALERILDGAATRQIFSAEARHSIHESWQTRHIERRRDDRGIAQAATAVAPSLHSQAAAPASTGAAKLQSKETSVVGPSENTVKQTDFATSKPGRIVDQTIDILQAHRVAWATVALIVFVAVAAILWR